jgi:hypothetical protein
MSNKIEQMLRKTEELLKASRNVRANTQGLSPETAYGRLKGYHERQGKEYKIGPDQEYGGQDFFIPPDLGAADPVYEGYGLFHPAHEIAHAQAMGFPQETDPEKPSWKGKTLADWQGYIKNRERHSDPYRTKDERIANQTSALHSRRAGIGLREDVHTIPQLDRSSLYGEPASGYWNNRQDTMAVDTADASTQGIQKNRRRDIVLAIQKVAQLRQKLIDLNIFQLRGGQWEKQTGPNARINERQFRQEHPQEAEQLLGKPTIPQLKKK